MALQDQSDWWGPARETQISSRQDGGLEEDPVVLSLLVAVALVLLQMIQAAFLWLSAGEKLRLEDDEMCGLTTGGQVTN